MTDSPRDASGDAAAGAIPESWYGALLPDVCDEILRCWPVWYHVNTPARASTILAGGLDADSEPRASAPTTPRYWARPGCVYLVNRDVVDWAVEWNGLADRDYVILAVDLRGIHPGRIFPDEDEWSDVSGYTVDPRDYDLPRSEDTEHGTTGLWAEAVRLGAQPGVSADALRSGRIAVRAPIEAALITAVELGPDEYLRDWERRHLAAQKRDDGSSRP